MHLYIEVKCFIQTFWQGASFGNVLYDTEPFWYANDTLAR